MAAGPEMTGQDGPQHGGHTAVTSRCPLYEREQPCNHSYNRSTRRSGVVPCRKRDVRLAAVATTNGPIADTRRILHYDKK